MDESNILKNSVEQSPRNNNNDLKTVLKTDHLRGSKQVAFKTEESPL